MANLIGQHLGQYEITALLGRGGMATVYRARQLNIKREVAVKVIKPDLAEASDFVRRFEREAETIAALEHPHIIKLFDYGQYGDMVYLVMQLLKGGSLAELIRQGPLTPEMALQVIDQIASALDYAHELGIVHRDLKPQNVLLDSRKNVHLTDFGIAKILSETTALTQSGVAMGTPAYMSPEQWQGQALDARADVYALGIMLYEVLAGRLPFVADTPYSMMTMHVNTPPPSILDRRADLPPGIEGVIQKALAKPREDRFSSAGELATALKAALAGDITISVPAMVTNAAPLTPGENTSLRVRSTPPSTGRAPVLPSQAGPPARGNRSLVLGIGVMIALLLIGGAALVLSGGRSASTTTPSIAPTTQIAALPTLTATLQATQAASPSETITLKPSQKLSSTPTLTIVILPTLTPTEGPTLDIVYVAQTADARDTAAAHLTAIAATQTQIAGLTTTATLWTATPTATLTPTPNITASLQAFRTSRAAATTAQYQANQTATATLWTPTPTPSPIYTPTSTPIPSVTANNQWTPVTRNFDGVEMVLVPPGCFMMGSTDGSDDEKPVNKQCFDAPFWIDKYEVTQGQFKQFGGKAAVISRFQGDNRPVEQITWFEARDFCTKRQGRLPTEAEWEYAARGPDNLVYPWGNTFEPDNVVYSSNSKNGTAEVGIKPNGVSWVGALDLSGNVWEWASSIYKPYPYSATDGRENNDNTNNSRALRGGSWNFIATDYLRTAYRIDYSPYYFLDFFGFRCVRAF